MFVFVTFLVIYIESISVDMLYSYSNVVHLFSFFFKFRNRICISCELVLSQKFLFLKTKFSYSLWTHKADTYITFII